MSSLIDLLLWRREMLRPSNTQCVFRCVCVRESKYTSVCGHANCNQLCYKNLYHGTFLKRKLESEASRCSFASSSSSSFMPVGSNNRKPLWSWDGFCRPERPLIPVACEVWNPLMPGWCAKGSAYWQTRAKLGKDGGRGLSRLLEEMQAQAWKIWTQSERRNRISHPLMNFLAVFIVFFSSCGSN